MQSNAVIHLGQPLLEHSNPRESCCVTFFQTSTNLVALFESRKELAEWIDVPVKNLNDLPLLTLQFQARSV